MKGQHIGEFEEFVLLAVCGLNDEAYAVSVQEHIETRTGRTPTMGAIYTALERLEQKKYLTSRLGEATRTRGGKRKRFYTVTQAGLSILAEQHQARMRLMDGLDLQPTGGTA